MRAAFADPAVFRERAEAGDDIGPSLEERILAFAATAEPFVAPRGRRKAISWPVLRDGVVLYPLRDLQRKLTGQIDGPAPALGDVTRAVRDLGGGTHGTVRLGSERRRVWSLPWRGGAHGGEMPRGAVREV